MHGTISQLHTGGSTNKTSDQRPVVLLNSVYQLLKYIINERLKRIVEPANLLEPGQGGGRQGRSVNGNMQKLHFRPIDTCTSGTLTLLTLVLLQLCFSSTL